MERKTLQRFTEGDPAAVRDLYHAYARPVFAVAYRALGDRGLAEEAVQLTFLQAWRAAASLEADREPAPWLYAIARRVAIDLYRRERRHQSSGPLEADIAVLPESIEKAWAAWEVRSAIEQIPEDEREVMRATHFLGLTQAETADRLGIPVGTVKSRSFRAYRRLAGLLAHVEEATG